MDWCKKQQIACGSTEWIYQFIWLDKKQKGRLYQCLRHNGKRYRKRVNLRYGKDTVVSVSQGFVRPWKMKSG